MGEINGMKKIWTEPMQAKPYQLLLLGFQLWDCLISMPQHLPFKMPGHVKGGMVWIQVDCILYGILCILHLPKKSRVTVDCNIYSLKGGEILKAMVEGGKKSLGFLETKTERENLKPLHGTSFEHQHHCTACELELDQAPESWPSGTTGDR